jgi:hypothetical protein
MAQSARENVTQLCGVTSEKAETFWPVIPAKAVMTGEKVSAFSLVTPLSCVTFSLALCAISNMADQCLALCPFLFSEDWW